MALAISSLKIDVRTSLRTRILAFVSAILATGALVLGYGVYASAQVAARSAYDRLLTGGVIQIAENVYLQGGVLAVDPPVAAISTLADFDLVFYRVVNPQGVTIAGYDDLVSRSGPAAGRSGVILQDDEYQGQRVRTATISKKIEEAGADAWAQIILAQTTQAQDALVWSLSINGIALICCMSALALAAVVLAVRIAFAPLVEIERELAKRQVEDLSEISADVPVEVRNLTTSINEFIQRLRHRMEIMQRFIADAAHQIRTPLAALDAQIEVLHYRKEFYGDDIDRLQSRISDLGRLTSQLLDHAMVIHRGEASVQEDVEINDLARSVLAQAVPLSLPREVDISFVPSLGKLFVKGDIVSLREALTNLVSNAIVHGAPSRLNVRILEAQSYVIIEVSDDGAGFARADLQKLLAPFVKGEQASSGSGLGLAIVAEVVRAHGGSLDVHHENLFTVAVSIPRQ